MNVFSICARKLPAMPHFYDLEELFEKKSRLKIFAAANVGMCVLRT